MQRCITQRLNYLQPAAKFLKHKKGDFPVAFMAKTSLSLPVHEFVKKKIFIKSRN